jgi:hypothetical protein
LLNASYAISSDLIFSTVTQYRLYRNQRQVALDRRPKRKVFWVLNHGADTAITDPNARVSPTDRLRTFAGTYAYEQGSNPLMRATSISALASISQTFFPSRRNSSPKQPIAIASKQVCE